MSHRAVCFSLIVPFLCASLVPAAAVAAVNEGMLYVKSEPSGATVFIDGEERGTTPGFISNIEPGRHTVQHYVRLWRRRAFAWDDDRASGHVGPTPFICERDSTVPKPPRMPDRVARAFEAPPGEPVETETAGGPGGGGKYVIGIHGGSGGDVDRIGLTTDP